MINRRNGGCHMSTDEQQSDVQKKFDYAFQCYESGDFKAAFEAYFELAELGNKNCQAFVGDLYYLGRGVGQDTDKACYWLEKASEGGEVKAQFLLGKIYAGKGEHSKAFEWYEKAGHQGYAPAIYKMAIYAEKGRVGSVDKTLALKLYREAAEKDHLYAKRTLAYRLLVGWGGIARIPEGIVWLYRMIVDGYKIGKQGDLESDSLRV